MSQNNSSLLDGKVIIITRAINQQSNTRKSFEAIGARVLDLPALVIGAPDEWGPFDDALLEIESFHWLIFSSANGVNAVQERLNLLDKNLRHKPDKLKIAAISMP